jgi:hypothetical protein
MPAVRMGVAAVRVTPVLRRLVRGVVVPVMIVPGAAHGERLLNVFSRRAGRASRR